MAKMRRAETFMGCCSLLFGVEIVCLCHLLTNIFLVSIASSVEPIEVVGVSISPTVQVLSAAWALGGIPIIIGAGVGTVYRIESHLRMYYWYLVLTFVLDTFWWLSLLLSGSICNTVVSSDVQRMGTAFVCGFTDTFVFFWILIGGVVALYFIYIVWSAAEEISSASYPELMKYRAVLRGAATPVPQQQMSGGGGAMPPVMGSRPVSDPSHGYYGSNQFASVGPPHSFQGSPQSFFPTPGTNRSY